MNNLFPAARFKQSRDVGVLLKFSRRVALRFTLTVQRRLGYTCHLLMLPCVFLGCMTLVVFCLPPERPDRHTLSKFALRETESTEWVSLPQRDGIARRWVSDLPSKRPDLHTQGKVCWL